MRARLWKCLLGVEGIACPAAEFKGSRVKCVSVKSTSGTSDVTVQRQRDRLAAEKLELLGWGADHEHFEAEEIILEICNMVKCKEGNLNQFVWLWPLSLSC